MILDTDFLFSVMNSDARALEKVVELDERRVPQRVPLLVIYELFVGVGAGGLPDQERQKIRRVLEPRTVPELTPAIVERAGIIQGELESSVEGIGAADAIIGATALVADEPVLTRNVDHFGRIEGLDTEPY